MLGRLLLVKSDSVRDELPVLMLLTGRCMLSIAIGGAACGAAWGVSNLALRTPAGGAGGGGAS